LNPRIFPESISTTVSASEAISSLLEPVLLAIGAAEAGMAEASSGEAAPAPRIPTPLTKSRRAIDSTFPGQDFRGSREFLFLAAFLGGVKSQRILP
jgi:hypothetical protein